MMAAQICTFYIGDLFLGLEVTQVQEVLRDYPITTVPLAPESVRGLINLRGQIVSAVDLRARLGVDEGPSGPTTAVVLDTKGGLLSLVVDRAGDVVEVDEPEFEKPPDTLKGEARRLIRGTYKLEHQLLLMLDVDRAFNLEPLSAREVEP
jgi:purine-binding chemotaxis protein CheW